MKNQEAILEFCLEAGAYKAAVLPVERIPFDKSLRAYCEANYCGSYKKNYACPPSVGDPDTVIAKARRLSGGAGFPDRWKFGGFL